MADEVLKRDQNRVTVLGGITDNASQEIVMLRVDPTTKRLLVSATGSGAGGVTSVSVVTANGISGSVANPTTTPAITLTLGAITPTSVNGLTITTSTGTLTITNGKTLSASNTLTLAGTDGKTLTISNTLTLAGTDSTTMTFPSTSATLARTDAGQTFTGTNVFGVITATTVNGLTISTSTGTLTVTNGKTLSVAKTLTLDGTDSTTMTFPTTSATIARTDAGQTFTGVQVFTSPSITTASLSGTQLLAEGASIGLDPSGSADGAYSGITMTATAGYTQAFGDLVYLSSADSRWEAADADAATTGDRLLAMVVVAGTDGNACTLLLQGTIRADAKFPALTIGSAVYVGETAGEIQVAIPTGADNVIRRVGYALTADSIYFCPSMDSQTTVA